MKNSIATKIAVGACVAALALGSAACSGNSSSNESANQDGQSQLSAESDNTVVQGESQNSESSGAGDEAAKDSGTDEGSKDAGGSKGQDSQRSKKDASNEAGSGDDSSADSNNGSSAANNDAGQDEDIQQADPNYDDPALSQIDMGISWYELGKKKDNISVRLNCDSDHGWSCSFVNSKDGKVLSKVLDESGDSSYNANLHAAGKGTCTICFAREGSGASVTRAYVTCKVKKGKIKVVGASRGTEICQVQEVGTNLLIACPTKGSTVSFSPSSSFKKASSSQSNNLDLSWVKEGRAAKVYAPSAKSTGVYVTCGSITNTVRISSDGTLKFAG